MLLSISFMSLLFTLLSVSITMFFRFRFSRTILLPFPLRVGFLPRKLLLPTCKITPICGILSPYIPTDPLLRRACRTHLLGVRSIQVRLLLPSVSILGSGCSTPRLFRLLLSTEWDVITFLLLRTFRLACVPTLFL